MKNFIRQHKLLVICAAVVLALTVAVIVGITQYNKAREIRSLIEEGDRYLDDLNYEQAIASYQQALNIDEKHRDANLALANVYDQNGNTSYAEAIYEAMLERSPKEAEAYQKLAEIYIREERRDEAQALTSTAMENVKSDEIKALFSLTHPDVPSGNPASGTYNERVRVELTAGERDTIYYTVDGTEPTTSSNVYEKPVILRNGTNVLKAIAVNASGYESETMAAEYTVNIQDQTVKVSEPQIERAIRAMIMGGGSGEVQNDDIEQITELYIIGSNYYAISGKDSINFTKDGYTINGYRYNSTQKGSMKTLSDLANMPYLETVVIAYQQDLDISALKGLTNIRRLSLIGNSLDSASLSAISGLTGLTELCLGWNEIDDISSLSGLTGLTTLSLWGNKISDVKPLAGLKSLTYLDLSDNAVSDISSLGSLTGLEELWIYQNKLTKVDVLTKLDSLHVLMIRDNPIIGVDPIRKIYPRLSRIDVDLLGLTNEEDKTR
ncbi:MAG: leucine-rich repeat domain-containing protein [Clostridia bacterium]|nr:leucine-rich repeat domain-containing protein [Clostridia bacterium]